MRELNNNKTACIEPQLFAPLKRFKPSAVVLETPTVPAVPDDVYVEDDNVGVALIVVGNKIVPVGIWLFIFQPRGTPIAFQKYRWHKANSVPTLRASNVVATDPASSCTKATLKMLDVVSSALTWFEVAVVNAVEAVHVFAVMW